LLTVAVLPQWDSPPVCRIHAHGANATGVFVAGTCA